jgi:hypothetical protein
MSQATQPTEVSTLAGKLDEMRARGFTAHFTVRGGRLLALDGPASFGPGEVAIAETHRFEGVSDPDDMAILYGLEVAGGPRGTLVDAFGVYADPSIGAFMEAVALGDQRAGRRRTR